MKNKYIYLLILFLVFYNTKVIAQISREKLEYFTETKGEFSLEISKSNCYCKVENNTEELPDISFGYNIQAALTAHALIQEARDRALNQWFDKQHTVLKNEIEKQLFKSFTSYNEARNTYFKHFEAEVTRKHSRPISDKYQSRYLDKANSKSISINNLKLLQLRENELKVGNINNSSYANFTFNGTPINQIKSITQLQTLWNNELTSFSNAYSGYHNDYYTYLKIREVSSATDYNNPYILELLNKQLANYNQYDRWQQLNLMQSYLNKIVPPLALPSGYINPKFYATTEYIENYALKNRGGGVSVFDDAYIDVIFGEMINSGVANTLPGGLQQAHYIAKGRTENLRKEELNKLLGEVKIEDLKRYEITKYINDIKDPITEDPIELYLLAQYKSNSLLDLSLYSIGSNQTQVGEYYLTPHYGLGNQLVFYTAYRNSSLGIEYIIKADALNNFKGKLSLYTAAANLFYLNGIPANGQIAMAAGDYFTGLKDMWADALSNPNYYIYLAHIFVATSTNLNAVNSTSKTYEGKINFSNSTLPNSRYPNITINNKSISQYMEMIQQKYRGSWTTVYSQGNKWVKVLEVNGTKYNARNFATNGNYDLTIDYIRNGETIGKFRFNN